MMMELAIVDVLAIESIKERNKWKINQGLLPIW